MKDIKDRITDVSPERRKLLERLLKERGIHAPELESRPAAEDDMAGVLKEVFVGRDRVCDYSINHDRGMIQDIYNAYHKQMSGAVFDDISFFMNLGYVETEAPQDSPIQLPKQMVGRKYVKLVLEVIGNHDLNGKRVLDVGCGRGGTIHTVQTYFKPALSIGVDLTSGGVEFSSRRHRFANTWFLRGNAEHLPFADGSFDAVTNVESSHHYGNVESFYRNVFRVLSPGGVFLYTTYLPAGQFVRDQAYLADMGFILERERNISPNVIAACDNDRTGVFSGFESDDNSWMANAASMPGSDTYNYMVTGEAIYKLFTYRKPA
jgi:SAM-dependent methyltransferase